MTWLRNVVVRQEFLQPSEVPRRYADADLADVPNKDLVAVARKYGANFWRDAEKGLAPLFVGDAFTWKTHTAAVLARLIRSAGVDVAWCNCASEISMFERSMFSETTLKRIAWLKEVPFLVMDDFSQIRPESRQMDILVEIGTARFDASRPTLWTGNIRVSKNNTGELTQAVGTCLSRRILDSTEGYRVSTKGNG